MYILSFWHKLIIWYWINNYLIEYKLDVTSLVSHWKQWVSLQVIRKFSEDEAVGLGGGEYLEKVIPGSKSLYNPWISPSWLWLYVKWPIKQKWCGPRAEKAIQTQGVGFSEAYVFASLLFSDFMYPWIYFFGTRAENS